MYLIFIYLQVVSYNQNFSAEIFDVFRNSYSKGIRNCSEFLLHVEFCCNEIVNKQVQVYINVVKKLKNIGISN